LPEKDFRPYHGGHSELGFGINSFVTNTNQEEMAMKKQILAVLLVLFAVSALFAGGRQATGGTSAGGATTTTPVGSYPLTTDATLTYWTPLNVNVSPNYPNLGETPFAKGLQERTGVKITYLHPPTGANADREQLNLMIADGTNLPDLVEYNWLTTYPGGPEKAIADGVILKLNDIIDQYCPNLKAYLKAHPEYDRMVKTDNGTYYGFPFIRGAEKLWYSQGLAIRKDWLDELGLQPPTTIDEWHTVLTAFKTRKNATAPFTLVYAGQNQRFFVESFGILRNFYIDARDNKVHYGTIDPKFREYLSTMAQWYKEGLIDPDFAAMQTAQVQQKVTSGAAGATVANVGSGIGTWTLSVRQTNPSYEWLPLAPPERVKGEKVLYTNPNMPYGANAQVAISASCKNVEIAARFLDWGYSDAGHLYYNFGIEGESYTMQNGKAIYTNTVMNNPQGWSVGQAMAAYERAVYSGPFIQDEGYIEQYYSLPEQRLALTAFAVPGAVGYAMPPLIPTPEESREIASIMNEINTYTDEMVVKFILGTETLNDTTWNNFINTIRRMNIDRAVTVYNAALTRYNAR
jgi:putative aldouronate transport system substrate-binding protein